MIFVCLQLLYYVGVRHKARIMSPAQGDTSLAIVWLSVQGEASIFPCLPAFLFLSGTWRQHIAPLRFTINMAKDGK